MAIANHFTVENYRNAEKPLPAGSVIVDTSANIGALSVEELKALHGDGIVSVDASENELVLTYGQILALEGVSVDATDRIVLRDTEENIEEIRLADVGPIAAKGVKLIDSISDNLNISDRFAAGILQTQISFDVGDLVILNHNTKLGGDLTPQQVEKFSAKGVDLIDFVSFNQGITNTISIEMAETLLGSDIRYHHDDLISLLDVGAKISGLSTSSLAGLKSEGIDSIDAEDDQLVLTLKQFKALDSTELSTDDLVTLKLDAPDVAGLSESQVAQLAGKGIDLLDAEDNKLILSVGQYSVLGTTKLSASDTVILSDNGLNLEKLSAAQISALTAAGVDTLDATNNRLSLSLDQYKALGAVGLSPDDTVTVMADSDTALTGSGHHLTLIGSAVRGTGNSLANIIKGNANSNTLWGLGGNDTIHGGSGNDKLYGGAGSDKDVFVFDARLNKSTNVDKIYDFSSRYDAIHLESDIFTKLGRGSTAGVKFKSDMFVEGTRAQDREDRIVYDKKTGSLYYDQDGTGSKAQVKIATINNKTKLYYHDFYVI